jgi:hypothetical protein
VRKERGNRRGEINAVDEHVNIENLLEGSAFGGFIEIPLDNILPGSIQSGISEN